MRFLKNEITTPSLSMETVFDFLASFDFFDFFFKILFPDVFPQGIK
jgi:hypothetical protein